MNFLQRSWITLIVMVALSPVRSPAFAGAVESCARNSPDAAMRVSGDFDGDSKTDKAIASFCGSSYRIEVHLSTKRLHVRLTVPIHNEVGLQLVAYDVDHDRRADLILISASS